MNLRSGYPYSLIRHGLPYNYPKLTSSLKTDVVIIGGGISGALTGYTLSEAGIDCVVVDGRTIGLGSTCASTSLLQYEIDVSLTDLIKKVGHKDAVRAYDLCRRSIYRLGSIAKKIGLKDFTLNKSLYYASFKKDVTFLKEEFASRRSNGFDVELLGEGDIKKKFGFTAPVAILSDDGAYADAYMFTHLLHQHGIKNGLRVYDRTYISKVTSSPRGVRLTTDDGLRINAKKIVYATGYEITEQLHDKIVKLHSTYATVSETLPNIDRLTLSDTMFWSTADPYLYLRQTNDGRLIVGGRDEEFFSAGKRDKLLNEKSKLLVKDFNKLFPDVEFKSEFSWTGTFGSTQDGLPFIGKHPKHSHCYFALGFGGNGITFSAIAAEILRDLFLGKKNSDARIFSFERVK